jgi:hypothetical protein
MDPRYSAPRLTPLPWPTTLEVLGSRRDAVTVALVAVWRRTAGGRRLRQDGVIKIVEKGRNFGKILNLIMDRSINLIPACPRGAPFWSLQSRYSTEHSSIAWHRALARPPHPWEWYCCLPSAPLTHYAHLSDLLQSWHACCPNELTRIPTATATSFACHPFVCEV